MSKTIRRLHRSPRSPLSHRPGEPYWPLSRQETIHMHSKHRRWPLGTEVLAKTPIGLLWGKVGKHWRSTEVRDGCTVDFGTPVDMGDPNGERYAHLIAFRNLRKVRRG